MNWNELSREVARETGCDPDGGFSQDGQHPWVVATVRIATMKERDACARMLELRDSELLLMAGEMTAQELRTVKAVLAQRASAIRMRSNVQGDRLRATTDLQEGEEA
jgi:hypothetical protein